MIQQSLQEKRLHLEQERQRSIKCISFDTTSVNSGLRNGTCILDLQHGLNYPPTRWNVFVFSKERCQRSCINYGRPRHSYYMISNKDLYKVADIDRIIKQYAFLKNGQIQIYRTNASTSKTQGEWYLDTPNTTYKPPRNIIHLNNTNRLFKNDIPKSSSKK